MNKRVARLPARWHRTWSVFWLVTVLVGLVFGQLSGRTLAQEMVVSTATGEVPTTGGRRPGPIRTIPAPPQPQAIPPVSIQIDKAGIDAAIETGDIVDGAMQDPSGPWVVAWYDDLAAPGEGGNAVLAGHVDYWDTGPAVFWNLKDLVPGDTIRLTGEDGQVLEYMVEWSKLYNVVTELTPEVIQTDVVGPTGQESLTLITCGGPFDAATGEYLERFVVRAARVT